VAIPTCGAKLEAQGVVTVKNVYNYASEGVPGSVFRYNGCRYATSGQVTLRAPRAVRPPSLEASSVSNMGIR
jgi:hypothetical protein